MLDKNFFKNIFKKKERSSELQEEKATPKKWHKIVIAIFLFLILVPLGAIFAFEYSYHDKVYEGIWMGNNDLSGKTKEEVEFFLAEETRKINQDGVTFFYQNKKTIVTPIITSAGDPDLSRPLFILDEAATLEKIYSLGRGSNLLSDLLTQARYFFLGGQVSFFYQIDVEEIKEVLKDNFSYLEKPAKEAMLEIDSFGEDFIVDIAKEESGIVFDYDKVISEGFFRMANLLNQPNELELIVEEPVVIKGDVTNIEEKVREILKNCSLVLSVGEKEWKVEKEILVSWLELQAANNNLVEVGLSEDKVYELLEEISEEVSIKAKNAKFKIEEGRVQEFQIHQGGEDLNLEASYAIMNNFILNLDYKNSSSFCAEEESNNIKLIVDVTAPQVPIASVNNLGIEELVGVGKSNFSGSPVNRRHNIRTGATALNGLIISPEEEFSVNKALGEINGATGYLPELVIKGNKTIPEYGGGLCQIATTVFRLALDAGLPITARRPHSYRVSYYEPAGTDATIYSPNPDLKFINDTPAYLLLQTRVEGNELIFEFWGTSDGRKVEMTEPKIYNFVSPGPTKIVETEDLAPGEKKCTERAHTGADAEFTRKIIPKLGEVKEEVWFSRYTPWSAVCLVGKETSVSPEPEVNLDEFREEDGSIDPLLLENL